MSDQGSEEPPRLICALSTRGLESQVLRLHLNSQRVRLVVVGTASVHLSGCLERQPEEEEESRKKTLLQARFHNFSVRETRNGRRLFPCVC